MRSCWMTAFDRKCIQIQILESILTIKTRGRLLFFIKKIENLQINPFNYELDHNYTNKIDK